MKKLILMLMLVSSAFAQQNFTLNNVPTAIINGQPGSYDLTFTGNPGWQSDISLSLYSCAVKGNSCNNVGISFSPAVVPTGTGVAQVILSANTGATVGTYTVIVGATPTDGSAPSYIPVTFIVTN